MNFEFATAPRIVFGRGEFARCAGLVAERGRRAMLVRAGAGLDASGAAQTLTTALAAAGVTLTTVIVRGEPDLATVDSAAATARAAGCDVVVGLGGGSVIDTAKAVAGLITNPGSALDYLEVVGAGKPIAKPAVPLIAVPTTAGTGSEVTRNAVVSVPEKHFKASLRSAYLIPSVALVDPALTDTVPPGVTASTGLDALTQLIEPYLSNRANPFTDGLALAGIRYAARSLRRAVEQPGDQSARDDLSLAAVMGGVCLANAGLGAVHGFAAPLGASYPVPHGMACAALLPHVMRANLSFARGHHDGGDTLARFARVGEALVGAVAGPEAADEGVRFIEELVESVGVPRLGTFGVTRDAVPEIVARARKASSMKYNPFELPEDILEYALMQAL